MKRAIRGRETGKIAPLLQKVLVLLLDGAAQLKQLHWTVKGPHFGPIHTKLDEIVDRLRSGADDVAERLTALGIAPDGRTGTVASATSLKAAPEGFVADSSVVTLTSDMLFALSGELQAGIGGLGDVDPVSQDLLIGITAEVEKQLWMMQAQEG